jgi:hypothetical protein
MRLQKIYWHEYDRIVSATTYKIIIKIYGSSLYKLSKILFKKKPGATVAQPLYIQKILSTNVLKIFMYIVML